MPAERTVHVVDDDAAIRRSLELLLDAAGFRVISYDTPLGFLDAALGLARDLEGAGVVVVKHAGPCGAAMATPESVSEPGAGALVESEMGGFGQSV